MKYFLVIILNLFYAVCYEINIPNLFVFFFTILMLVFIYYYTIKTNSKPGALLELLCFTLPFAWRSIFGKNFSTLPVCWFYIVGLIYFLKLLFSKKFFRTSYVSKEGVKSILCIIFLISWGIIPLFNSYNFINGLTEYLAYAFFYALTFVSIFHEGTLNDKNRYEVLKSFIFVGLYCSVAIIIQFLLSYFGINILNNEIFGSYNVRRSYSYLFEDMSSASIFLVSGAMLCLVYTKKVFKHPYFISTIIFIGTAFSSTRTGIVAFFLVAILYSLKNNKVIILVMLALLLGIASKIYSLIRPSYDLVRIITYDNGRFGLLESSILLILKNLFWGYGFDSSIFIKLSGLATVIHTYPLTLLFMTGIVYFSVFFSLVISTFTCCKKKRNKGELWALILCFFASCFIPNIIGARFLVILFCVIYLSKKTANEVEIH